MKLAIYNCYPCTCQTTQKRVFFYMLITLKHKKVVEKLLKTLFYGEKNTHLLNGHMLQVYIRIASMRQFQCTHTTNVTKIKETYLEIYNKQVSCPLALPLLNISNCESVLKCLSIGYIYMTAISPNFIS